MKIYLIGYRCTGKTTIGKSLAADMGYDFMDTDRVIEKEISSSIAKMVEADGWEAFRTIEKKTLFNTKCKENIIISTGGGIILDPDNREFIKETGNSIWLDADIQTIISRLEADQNTADSRPSLTTKNLETETRELLELRRPLYESTADIKIDTGNSTPEEIVTIIKRRLI